MEVVNPNCALLCNAEVLMLLREVQAKKRKLKSNKNLATIAYESIKYLQDSPAYGQTAEDVRNFLTNIQGKLRLTKSEKLQILNHKPTSMVELQLLIEENEERFSEDAMQFLLNLVNDTLNGQTMKEEGDHLAEEEEMRDNPV